MPTIAIRRKHENHKSEPLVSSQPLFMSVAPERGMFQPLNQWEPLQGAPELWAQPQVQMGRFPLPQGLAQFRTAESEGICAAPVNVRETEDAFLLEAYIPGMRRDDIHVDVKNGTVLTIKAERSHGLERERKLEGYLRKEFSARCFYRSFALPLEVKAEDIAAKYDGGVLEIVLPKTSEAKASNYAVPVRG